MGFSSQPGHVILRSQTVQGTYNSDTGTAGVAVKLRSGALGSNRDLLIPDPEIGGGRDISDAYLGAASWSGDYDLYPRYDSITTLLKAALGNNTDATATGVNTHTLTPSDASQLPFLSIEEEIGAGLETYQYTDAVVNTLHLEAEANGYLMGTVGIVGARQTAGNTPTDPTALLDTGPMTVGTNITVTYNGVTLPARSFSFDLNNNFEDDDYRLGSFYVGDLSPKQREITAGFSIRETSSALWRQAVYGVSTATSPGGVPTKNQLVITCSTYETIPGSAPATAYSMSLTIPKFILSPYSFAASGDDIITDDVSGQAVRPSFATPILTVVVKNNKAAVA